MNICLLLCRKKKQAVEVERAKGPKAIKAFKRKKNALLAASYSLVPAADHMDVKKNLDYDRFKTRVLELDWDFLLKPLKFYKPHQTSWSTASTSVNSPKADDHEPDSDSSDPGVRYDYENLDEVPSYPETLVCAFAQSCWMLQKNNKLPFVSIYAHYQKALREQTEQRLYW